MTKKAIDLETGVVTFDFEDGKDALVFDPSKCSDAIRTHLELHGAGQKIGDSYASAKKAETDLGVNPVEWSRAQAEGVIAQLYADDWTVRTAGGPSVTDLAVALSEATGATVEETAAKLAEADKDTKKAIRSHPDVAAILARIRREKAEKKEKALAEKVGSGPDLAEFMTA